VIAGQAQACTILQRNVGAKQCKFGGQEGVCVLLVVVCGCAGARNPSGRHAWERGACAHERVTRPESKDMIKSRGAPLLP